MTNGIQMDVVGNLTRDPELRFTPAGKAVASFGMAVNRRWKAPEGTDWEEAVTFLNVSVWGDMAENLVGSDVKKGTRVMVSGRYDQREYEDKEGEKRTTYDLTADEIGVALKWATVATVARTTSGGGGGRRETPPPPGDEYPGF